ncbi:MAG: hypothetical protein R3A79_25600 [Nannocystaceae bacterium]
MRAPSLQLVLAGGALLLAGCPTQAQDDGGASATTTGAGTTENTTPSTTTGPELTSSASEVTTSTTDGTTSTSTTASTTSTASTDGPTTSTASTDGPTTSTTTTDATTTAVDSGPSSTTGDPCVGSAVLTDDDDLAALAGVRCVEGNLEIVGDFDDLSPLSELEEVGGLFVTAYEDSLWDLNPDIETPPIGPRTLLGLSSLRSVGGLWIHGDRLEGLEGLEQLEQIGELGLWIEDPGVTDLTALNALKSLGGFLWLGNARPLTGLDSLAPLAGINHLTHHAWDPKALSIRRTGITDLSGLENLFVVDGVIDIGLNPALTSVADLDGLIGDGYLIYANPGLSDCAARSVVPAGVPARVVGNLDDGCVPATICDPFDSFDVGACEAVIPGIRWSGTACEYHGSGCNAGGSEYPLAHAWHSFVTDVGDMAACEAAFAGC